MYTLAFGAIPQLLSTTIMYEFANRDRLFAGFMAKLQTLEATLSVPKYS